MTSLAQTVFITGASRGLGLEFVKQIVQLSPKVLIAGCRNPAGASDLKDIAKANPFVKVVQLDVEKDDNIDAAVKEVKSLVGDAGLNLLINNAGIYLEQSDGGGIRQQTRDRLLGHFQVNSVSPIIVTQKCLPLLELAASKQKASPLGCAKAAVVLISSIMGSQTFTFQSGFGAALDYKCSKSAITMAGILMAREMKESGILVLTLHPGWVRTDMGGPKADISQQQSVEGMLKVMKSSGEKEAGSLRDYSGEVLPF